MDYDWDSVEIGQPQINDSQNFFRKLNRNAKLEIKRNDENYFFFQLIF